MASQRDVLPIIRERFAALKRLDYAAQVDAIRVLEKGKEPLDELLLLYLTDDPSPWIREEAVDALWTRGGPLARIATRSALEDPKWPVRNRAAEALGQVGSRLDVPRLIHALHDPEWVVRASAASSLGSLGGSKTRQALIQALRQDMHPSVRRDAAIALADLHDRSLIPVLESVLARETEALARVGMLRALYLLGEAHYLRPWLLLLKDEDDTVRHNIVNSADEIAAEDRNEAIAALREMIVSETNPGVKSDAEKAVRALLTE